MSRIGKKPISVPAGVTVTCENNHVTVKGPKGEIAKQFSPELGIAVEDGVITVTRPTDDKDRAAWVGKEVVLGVGFSHPVNVPETDDIKLDVPQPNTIVVSGIDKQAVGQYAAEIREKRPPEPYKGKGIRYENEHIIRKEGKAGKGKK